MLFVAEIPPENAFLEFPFSEKGIFNSVNTKLRRRTFLKKVSVNDIHCKSKSSRDTE